MSERSEYSPGEFCWVDLATPDIEASAKFYGELVGWEREAAEGPVEETGGYSTFTHKGKAVAGVGPIMGEGQPPAWSSYVAVADADETAAKVTEAGGKVLMKPFDIPGGAGRMAVCQDGSGAFFSVYQPKGFQGAELVNEVGTWTWNQLATRDLEAARDFYGTVFGWRLTQAEDAPPDLPYYMWQVDGQRWEEGIAGAMLMGDEMPADVPPSWGVYFAVADAAAAVETTTGAGGSVIVPVTDIPVGRFAVLLDPQGAAVALLQPDYPEPR